MRGYEILKASRCCDRHSLRRSRRQRRPPADVYGFFKSIGAAFISFLRSSNEKRTRRAASARRAFRPLPGGPFSGPSSTNGWPGHRPRQGPDLRGSRADGFRSDHSLCLFRPVAAASPSSSATETSTVRSLRPAGASLGQHPKDNSGRSYRQPGPTGLRPGQSRNPAAALPGLPGPGDVQWRVSEEPFSEIPDGEAGLNYLCAATRTSSAIAGHSSSLGRGVEASESERAGLGSDVCGPGRREVRFAPDSGRRNKKP